MVIVYTSTYSVLMTYAAHVVKTSNKGGHELSSASFVWFCVNCTVPEGGSDWSIELSFL